MFIDINGKKIHYLREGRGEPFLLVHGWGGSIKSLYSLFSLASQHFDCIIIDLPGFGKSDPPDTNWGIKSYSDIVLYMIKKLDLKNLYYFGHSFGGGIGIYLAANNPTIFNNLILSGSAFQRSNIRSETAISFRKKPLQNIPFYSIWEAPAKKLAYRIFFRNSELYKFPQLESNFRKIITEDLTEYAGKVKTKTLILWGDQDTYTPVEQAYTLHKLIPNSKLKIFEKYRHNLPLKYPELVYKEIKKFIHLRHSELVTLSGASEKSSET